MEIKKKKILLLITTALIIVSLFAKYQHNQINQYKQTIGIQIEARARSINFMCLSIEDRINNRDALTNYDLLHVNQMIYSDSILGSDYDALFQFIYEPKLKALSEAESEEEKEQLINEILIFHRDIEEINTFIKSKGSADYRKYADLLNTDSSVYKEFINLIDTTISENSNTFSIKRITDKENKFLNLLRKIF